jgi:hypothetical protein
MSDDLNLIAKQLDYQSAQISSLYNLFNSEIDKEISFTNRIKSKTSILQLYSNSPGNDLYYTGDSFDNLDFVEIGAVQSSRMAYVNGGSAKLPVASSIDWLVDNISIDQQNSNGFIGNNHAVYASGGESENYKFYWESNPTSGLLQNIVDQSPLTVFEYESINILKTTRLANGSKDFEFLYSKNEKVEGKDVTTYSSWADHDERQPLRLTMVLSSTKPKKANSLTIHPYFGPEENLYPELKVTRITAMSHDTNTLVELLPEDIYIGSTIVPQSMQAIKNYFYDKAIIEFQDVNTREIKVYFEQNTFNNVKVKHLFWKPTADTTGPLRGQSRFNPETLYSLGYEGVNYNLLSLIPRVQNPNEFKANNNINRTAVSLSGTIPHTFQDKYVVRYNQYEGHATPPNNVREWATPNLVSYYWQGLTNNVNSNINQYVLQTNTNYLPTLSISNAFRYDSLSEAESAIRWIGTQFTTNPLWSRQSYGYAWNSAYFLNMRTQKVTDDLANTAYKQQVQLQKSWEIYDAKKWSIAFRSIEAHYNVHYNNAEIVSKSFSFPYPVKNLMISSEVSNSVSERSSLNSTNSLKYYVSVDDGQNWIAISPIENPFLNIPEVLSFNENVQGSVKVPGVSYFNYPQIPKEVRKIKVKIELSKPNGSNTTPIIHSYKLSAKVEQI